MVSSSTWSSAASRDQPGAEERAAGKIERSDRLTRSQDGARSASSGLARSSPERSTTANARGSRRPRPPQRRLRTGLPPSSREGGAQHLVPADDLARSRDAARRRPAPAQPHGGRHVVERVAAARSRSRNQKRCWPNERGSGLAVAGMGTGLGAAGRRLPASAASIAGCRAAERRRLEQRAQRQLDVEHVPDARKELGRQQRMAA